MQNRVRELRLRHKMTQDTLADKVGVSRYTISCIENAKHVPSGEFVIKVGLLFKTDPREIFFVEGV